MEAGFEGVKGPAKKSCFGKEEPLASLVRYLRRSVVPAGIPPSLAQLARYSSSKSRSRPATWMSFAVSLQVATLIDFLTFSYARLATAP